MGYEDNKATLPYLNARMQGGSATLILLDAVCTLGTAGLARVPPLEAATNAPALREAWLLHASTVSRLYATAAPAIAELVAAGSTALCTAVAPSAAHTAAAAEAAGRRFVSPTGFGRILYVGAGTGGCVCACVCSGLRAHCRPSHITSDHCLSRRLLGLIDASEATDTYGSPFGAVRGFCAGSWPGMRCAGGLPAEHTLTVPGELRVDSRFWEGPLAPELASPGFESFVADVVPTLCPSDLVVFCHSWEPPSSAASVAGIHDEEAVVALEKAAAAGASVRHVIVCPRGRASEGDALLSRVRSVASLGVCVDLPQAGVLSSSGVAEPPALLCALALKLVLNAISTGAHAAKGLVVGNVMANM